MPASSSDVELHVFENQAICKSVYEVFFQAGICFSLACIPEHFALHAKKQFTVYSLRTLVMRKKLVDLRREKPNWKMQYILD